MAWPSISAIKNVLRNEQVTLRQYDGDEEGTDVRLQVNVEEDYWTIHVGSSDYDLSSRLLGSKMALYKTTELD